MKSHRNHDRSILCQCYKLESATSDLLRALKRRRGEINICDLCNLKDPIKLFQTTHSTTGTKLHYIPWIESAAQIYFHSIDRRSTTVKTDLAVEYFLYFCFTLSILRIGTKDILNPFRPQQSNHSCTQEKADLPHSFHELTTLTFPNAGLCERLRRA